MDSGFQFLDLILLAMVAGFLILRLRSVLGRRTGHEPPRQREAMVGGTAGEGKERAGEKVAALPERRADAERTAAPRAQGGLMRIRHADPLFDADHFLSGAKAAFEMIVGAFAKGDTAALEPLLSKDVYHGFARAIDERNRAGHTLETTIVALKESAIVDAELDGREATITVRFVSDQVNVTRDRDGRVVDGDPDRVTEVTDLWTFRRDTRAADPNWQLVATAVPD